MGACFQFGLSAGADLESTEALVGHPEPCGQHVDRDACTVALAPQLMASRIAGAHFLPQIKSPTELTDPLINKYVSSLNPWVTG